MLYLLPSFIKWSQVEFQLPLTSIAAHVAIIAVAVQHRSIRVETRSVSDFSRTQTSTSSSSIGLSCPMSCHVSMCSPFASSLPQGQHCISALHKTDTTGTYSNTSDTPGSS